MPNDAKFGLVIGVGLVIALGVVYYRKDAGAAPVPPGAVQASANVDSRPAANRSPSRTTRGRPVSRNDDGPQDEPAPVEDPMNPASP